MIDKVAGAAVQGAGEAAKASKVESFGKAMEGAKRGPGGAFPDPKQANPTARAEASQPAQAAKPLERGAKVQSAQSAHTPPPQPVQAKPHAAALLNEVNGAQQKLDQLLKMAESGRTFSPTELIAFQAHAYRASQELDLASKVVEKATSGVKQTLNTQV